MITHLCLVSSQITPNLTPALDPSLRPARVVLLTSPDMRQQAAWLGTVLNRRGIRVDEWPIENPWDVEQVQDRVLELLETLSQATAEGVLTLNVTGGTKPMALAAYEACRAYDLPIFYVHPERDRLIWLHPRGRPALELDNRVKLDDFLAAHGTALISRQDRAVPRRLRALTDWLVTQNAHIARPLATLNWLASRAQNGLVTPELDTRQQQDTGLGELIARFADEGLLSRRGKRLQFPDEDARFYVNGGWLEEHVYGVLRALRGELPHIQDLARSVDITRESGRGDPVPNEIDVACLADNRLHVIECKTRTWSDNSSNGPGAEALYRLDTLGDLLGGIQTRSMLISYRELPAPVLRRASALHVGVCHGARLPEMSAILRNWIRP